MDDSRSTISVFTGNRSYIKQVFQDADSNYCESILNKIKNTRENLLNENETYIRYAKNFDIDVAYDAKTPRDKAHHYRHHPKLIQKVQGSLTKLNKIVIFMHDGEELRQLVQKLNNEVKKMSNELRIHFMSFKQRQEEIKLGYIKFHHVCYPHGFVDGEQKIARENIERYFRQSIQKKEAYMHTVFATSGIMQKKIKSLRVALLEKEDMGQTFSMIDYIKTKMHLQQIMRELQEKKDELKQKKILFAELSSQLRIEKDRRTQLQRESKGLDLAIKKINNAKRQADNIITYSDRQLKLMKELNDSNTAKGVGLIAPQPYDYLNALRTKQELQRQLKNSQINLNTLKRQYFSLKKQYPRMVVPNANNDYYVNTVV